jgi:hypothetical protein
VSPKEGLRLGHIGPFRETLSPPLIVLRDGVELRQVKGDGSRVRR